MKIPQNPGDAASVQLHRPGRRRSGRPRYAAAALSVCMPTIWLYISYASRFRRLFAASPSSSRRRVQATHRLGSSFGRHGLDWRHQSITMWRFLPHYPSRCAYHWLITRVTNCIYSCITAGGVGVFLFFCLPRSSPTPESTWMDGLWRTA